MRNQRFIDVTQAQEYLADVTLIACGARALRVRRLTRAARIDAMTTFLAATRIRHALVALSLYLRTRDLDAGFWIDEGLSVGIADRPLADIPGVLRLDGSPPLYYSLLHVWMALAGRSEEETG